MMDEYVEPDEAGGFRHCPVDAHYRCRRFAHEEIARRHEGDDVSALEDAVREYLYGRMDDHGCRADTAWREEIVGQDVKLNAQGLEVWLSRQARS